MKENTGIYKIINITNNKIYIGSASFLDKRKGNHFDSLRDNKHKNIRLQNAYNKYGKENFTWEVLEYCTKVELLNREQFYLDTILFAKEFINKENKKFEELGYNIQPLAESSMGIKRREATKQKLRETKKSPLFTRKGCKDSPDVIAWKKKMMKELYAQGKMNSPFSDPKYKGLGGLSRKISVIQISKNDEFIKEWASATDAANELKINSSKISSCCKGNRKTTGKFKWKYKE